ALPCPAPFTRLDRPGTVADCNSSPRSHEPDPIDAFDGPCVLCHPAGALRALTSAAPLKPTRRRGRPPGATSSPRSHERGPIEADWPLDVEPPGVDLSALSRARPH